MVAAVIGAHVERETIAAAIRRRHADAAEGVDPFSAEPRAAKPGRHSFQRRHTLAQRLAKTLAYFGILDFRDRIGGLKDDLVEPRLVALQQRPDGGGRFGERRRKCLVDLRDQPVVAGLFAEGGLEPVAVGGAAQLDRRRRAAARGDIIVYRMGLLLKARRGYRLRLKSPVFFRRFIGPRFELRMGSGAPSKSPQWVNAIVQLRAPALTRVYSF
jgi:hypothetical protein